MMSDIYLAKSDLTGRVYAVKGKSKTDVTEFVVAAIKLETAQLRTDLDTAVQALERFVDVSNWNEEQYEAFDADGMEHTGFRFTFDDGDPDNSPIRIAREALAKIGERKDGRQ